MFRLSKAPGQTIARPVKPRMQAGPISRARTARDTSLASIFLPRNSGLRPTISPTIKTATMTYWIRYMNPTPTPPNTAVNWRLKSAASPPKGVSESCMLLTDPVSAAVVMAVNILLRAGPKRTSLPSMLPPLCSAVRL